MTTIQDLITDEALGGAIADAITAALADLDLDKADVGLDNVDNTSDAAKPVSTATQTALNTKVASATIDDLVVLTASAYAALSSKVSTTLYVVVG